VSGIDAAHLFLEKYPKKGGFLKFISNIIMGG
jgi:hypothetical protein